MNHFSIFIDESGNPSFYAKRKRPLWTEPEFEPIMLLGMIVVKNRKVLRKNILDFQDKILNDPLFNSIYSVKKPDWYLHASKDHSDIRLKFFECLRVMSDVECYVVIARKIPEIFHHKHNSNAAEFYFDLLNKLLSRFTFPLDCNHILYLSRRQSNTIDRFESALKKALELQSKQHNTRRYQCRIVPSSEYPELSVVDYMLWALKRYIVEGEERFFLALRHLFVEINDVYDNEGKGRIYTAQNPFALSKASPYIIK